MRFTDTEADVIAFLDAREDAPISQTVPSPRPPVFALVWGSGGSGVNRVVDDVQLTIEGWAEGDADTASALTLRLRDHLLHEWSQIPYVRRVEATRPYWAPDPDTKTPRYRFTARLRVRAAR